jgi:hypothetical protein
VFNFILIFIKPKYLKAIFLLQYVHIFSKKMFSKNNVRIRSYVEKVGSYLGMLFLIYFRKSTNLHTATLTPTELVVTNTKRNYFIFHCGEGVRLTTSLSSVSRVSRENMGASTSHKPMGLHSLLQGELYLSLWWRRKADNLIVICEPSV